MLTKNTIMAIAAVVGVLVGEIAQPIHAFFNKEYITETQENAETTVETTVEIRTKTESTLSEDKILDALNKANESYETMRKEIGDFVASSEKAITELQGRIENVEKLFETQ